MADAAGAAAPGPCGTGTTTFAVPTDAVFACAGNSLFESAAAGAITFSAAEVGEAAGAAGNATAAFGVELSLTAVVFFAAPTPVLLPFVAEAAARATPGTGSPLPAGESAGVPLGVGATSLGGACTFAGGAVEAELAVGAVPSETGEEPCPSLATFLPLATFSVFFPSPAETEALPAASDGARPTFTASASAAAAACSPAGARTVRSPAVADDAGKVAFESSPPAASVASTAAARAGPNAAAPPACCCSGFTAPPGSSAPGATPFSASDARKSGSIPTFAGQAATATAVEAPPTTPAAIVPITWLKCRLPSRESARHPPSRST